MLYAALSLVVGVVLIVLNVDYPLFNALIFVKDQMV
jgi:hypothetical protein